jgi:hypothetical protein
MGLWTVDSPHHNVVLSKQDKQFFFEADNIHEAAT